MIGLPIKKCPGVSAKASLGSVETYAIGLEFRPCFNLCQHYCEVFKKQFCSSNAVVQVAFKDLTVVSHSPPKFGALGGIVSQVILFSLPNVDIKSSNS